MFEPLRLDVELVSSMELGDSISIGASFLKVSELKNLEARRFFTVAQTPLGPADVSGPQRRLTATVTATSVDDSCGGRVVRDVGQAEDAAEGVDGLALEAEPDVGVDADGDTSAAPLLPGGK